MRNRKCSACHLGESKVRGIVRDFSREANGSETPNRQIWIQYVCRGKEPRGSSGSERGQEIFEQYNSSSE